MPNEDSLERKKKCEQDLRSEARKAFFGARGRKLLTTNIVMEENTLIIAKYLYLFFLWLKSF